MTLFEFILVLVSLILAIGVTQLLQGVSGFVRYQQDLGLKWVPFCWAGSLFLLTTAHWWSLWDMRELEWTYPTFFFVLLPPTVQYFAISLLVSMDVESDGTSLAEEFQQIRVPFLSAVLSWVVLLMWDGAILGVEAVWNSLRMNQSVGVAMLILGLASPSWTVQKLVAAVMLASIALGAFVLRFLPGFVY